MKFLEHERLLFRRDARSRIPHLKLDPAAARPCTENDLAAHGVFDGVREQVLEHATQQPWVGIDDRLRLHDAQFQSLCPCHRLERKFELGHEIAQRDRTDLRLELARVEPRDVEERAQDFFNRIERGIDVLREPHWFGLQRALDQTRGVQPRGVERLKQIVARRREEPSLRKIGLAERVVDAHQLSGALGDAALQRFVGARQSFGRGNLVGDVEVGGDDTALRHRRDADFQDAPRRLQMLAERIAAHRKLYHALGNLGIHLTGPKIAALGTTAQNLFKRNADPTEIRRQVQ